MSKDTYSCDTCGLSEKWDAHDDRRGDIWECEKCYEHFCTSCFVKALGAREWTRMLQESDKIYCPRCYCRAEVQDYMIFEEETSQSYPFQKLYGHLTSDEIDRIVSACNGCFDTESIYAAIVSVVGLGTH